MTYLFTIVYKRIYGNTIIHTHTRSGCKHAGANPSKIYYRYIDSLAIWGLRPTYSELGLG